MALRFLASIPDHSVYDRSRFLHLAVHLLCKFAIPIFGLVNIGHDDKRFLIDVAGIVTPSVTFLDNMLFEGNPLDIMSRVHQKGLAANGPTVRRHQMIRTIDTYRSVSRTVTAQIVFNDQAGDDSRRYQVERRDTGVSYGARWYQTEVQAREHANNWIEHPDMAHMDTVRA